MDGSLPGSSVQGIVQARVLEWAATSCPRSSKPDSLSLKALGHDFLMMEERVEVFIAKSSIASCTVRVMLKF